MTIVQEMAIWELCRQGFPLDADQAESSWEHGKHFGFDGNKLRVPVAVRQLIDRANRETGRLPVATPTAASR